MKLNSTEGMFYGRTSNNRISIILRSDAMTLTGTACPKTGKGTLNAYMPNPKNHKKLSHISMDITLNETQLSEAKSLIGL